MTLRSFLLRLCIFISVELVMCNSLRVKRVASGDEFPNDSHPTVTCNSPEGTVTSGTCKCNNKGSLFITNKVIRCHTYRAIKQDYYNLSAPPSGTPITELTLSSSTNEIGITQWDTLKTLTQIYSKGKLLDSSSCPVPPTVKEVDCNLIDKYVWVECPDVYPVDFVIRSVPSVVNAPKLYKLQIKSDAVSTKFDFEGQLLALNIVCNATSVTTLNGYLIFKITGTRTYTPLPVSTSVPTVSQSTNSSKGIPHGPTPKIISDGNVAIILGGVLGGLGLILGLIAIVCFILYQRRRKRRRTSVLTPRKEDENKTELSKFGGNDDKAEVNDSNNSALYEEILEPQYQGLYLKPQEDKYTPAQPAPSQKSVNSAYEVDNGYS